MKSNSIFKNKISLLAIFLALSAGSVFALYQEQGLIDEYFQKKYYKPVIVKIRPAKLVKIGFTTDVHAQFRNSVQSINRESKLTMESFVVEMKAYRPDFVIDGGDYIEGTKRTETEAVKDFQDIQKIFLSGGNIPAYYVLGNHELRGFSRQKWLELTGLGNSFYYFDVENLRVIVLDGNYQPSSSQGDIAIEPGLTYTRGYVSQEQMVWLENLLQESKAFRKIVFLHQPPLGGTIHKTNRSGFPVNARQLREVFSKYGVMAVFSGHIEEAYHEKIDGVDYFVMPGFHKDNDQDKGQEFYKGVFSAIEVTRDVRIKMFFKNLDTGGYEFLWLNER